MDFKISKTTPASLQEIEPTKKIELSKDFEFTLKRIGSEGLQERLEVLIGDIVEQGNTIARNQNISELKKYRTMVQEFINEVVTNSHEFSRENFLDRRGRHRVYGIVRVINEELDLLAQDVLASENKHLEILERTDNIRGLLLDMLI